MSACHLSSTGWWLGLLQSLTGVYCRSDNTSHAGLQMPPALCQLYMVQWDMPIKPPGLTKDSEHSGHREHTERPLHVCISVFH